ncbi:MAG: DUF4384 domain-containing protein [Candidatus Coatesbacteria bacterium]
MIHLLGPALAAGLALAAPPAAMAADAAAVKAAGKSLSAQLVKLAGSRKLTVAVEDFTVGESGFGGASARRLRNAVELGLKANPRFKVVTYAALRAGGNKGYVVRGRVLNGRAEAWLDQPGGHPVRPERAVFGMSASAELAAIRIRHTRGIDVEEVTAAVSAPADVPAATEPAVSTAPASEEPVAAAVVVADQPETTSDLKVELWTDRGEAATYQGGEEIVVHVRANRDCTLRLVYVDAEGKLNTIFPNDWSSPGAGRIRAGVIYTIPSSTDDFKFTVTPPFGNEAIKALATTGTPGEALPALEGQGTAAVTRGLRRTRGIMLEAAPATEPSSGLETAPAYAESAATVTTVDQPGD